MGGVHFIPDLKVGVFVTLRATDLIKQPSRPISTILRLYQAIRFLILHISIFVSRNHEGFIPEEISTFVPERGG